MPTVTANRKNRNAPKLGAIAPNLGARRAETSPATALFGSTRQAVLGLLYTHPEQAFHMRQIARAVSAGQGAVQRELRHLTAAGILRRSVRGHQVLYQANGESPIFAELRGLVVKTVGLADVLRNALAALADRIHMAFIYGSMADGSFRADSDVDVLVVGDVTFAEIVSALGPAQEMLGREVNPAVYSSGEVRTRLGRQDHFLTSLLAEAKIFLVGDDDDFAELAEKRLADGASQQPAGD
ncbi:MAG: ArsR family transcriptional regulator [Chloroflexi bacterium]|nr:ArsR family transcriptional regulator [Chloroflexota bacterium]